MRELATGSTTSSRVIELMSNQASHVFHATHAPTRKIEEYTAVAAVVLVQVRRVQSFVQESVLVRVLLHTIVPLAFLSLVKFI